MSSASTRRTREEGDRERTAQRPVPEHGHGHGGAHGAHLLHARHVDLALVVVRHHRLAGHAAPVRPRPRPARSGTPTSRSRRRSGPCAATATPPLSASPRYTPLMSAPSATFTSRQRVSSTSGRSRRLVQGAAPHGAIAAWVSACAARRVRRSSAASPAGGLVGHRVDEVHLLGQRSGAGARSAAPPPRARCPRR